MASTTTTSSRLTLSGNEELAVLCLDLPKELVKRVLEIVFREAAWELCAAVAAGARRKTGAMKASLTVIETRPNGIPSAQVRPNPKAKMKHAHLVEWGTKPHDVTTTWRSDEKIPYTLHHPGSRAFPFFWPAIDSLSPKVEAEIIDAISSEIEAFWEAHK